MTVKFESLYTGTEGRILRVLPLSLGVIDSAIERQRVLAVAEWSADDKEEAISFYAFTVRSDSHTTAPSDCALWRRFVVKSRVTALQIASDEREGMLLLAGTASGSLLRLRVRYRHHPIRTPEDMEWRLLDGDLENEDVLTAWKSPHTGEISSLDFRKDMQEAVSTGRDGAILLHSLATGEATHHVKKARSSASYSGAKWTSASTFLTVGTTGGIELWDSRQAVGQAAARSPLSWGHTGCKSLDAQEGLRRRITAVDVHPSRPHLCATGASAATIATWDLRFAAAPTCQQASRDSLGDVTEIHFDGHATESGEPSLVFSTEDGGLFAARCGAAEPSGRGALDAQGAPGSSVRALISHGPVSIPSFGLDPADGRDIFGVGGQESLLYLHRTPGL